MGTAERKQRELEQKEAFILETAERVFAAKGFAATAVEDLASTSEFSVGTLYNIVGNKETILAKVVLRNLTALAAEEPTIDANAPALPQLNRFFDAHIERLYSRPDLVRLIRSFDSPDIQQRIEPQLLERIRAARHEMLKPLFALIQAGQDRGEIRRDASSAGLSLIFVTLFNSFVHCLDAPRAAEIEAQFGVESQSLLRQGISMLLESLTLQPV